ncbi:DNA polymerase III subunit gamma and tau [Microbacterium sp. SORGH_AS_0888]|uniref:DNA polymerase III subunit gamma and tau n=1 Tax=Microbacterium sp. SORGH_AS_0888 TaxID=3041791 RepID=UPI002781575D|nr:DNA polymerase III subunit gamma and tau [Microbacterium sp. SORGH_AS_0888]MDQ1130835.1 DNA polymerase-3 subunit gamma/tau [Microbacterium sp. SORGH_AS_0888]
MTAALYRRYRPEAFGEMIGQSQVTDPLMTALRADRIGHAYLFSGPRGCGKTTSARILARCLNCAAGPTDTPCGVCDSCVELGRGGGGSLDVVEIDAASHNGVDDARDLRERAIFAPARDRFKIFILDEAHMVTPQGFNALLKLVEEPPEHVKFIFATTEPEKVIGTIRSRTHHYPFRLVPPAAMLEYVQQLCEQEGVQVEAGVLPLVVRAGGGSPRDTLSLLDQLIAGSEGPLVAYERAVALLGYTHGELLDAIVDALGDRDAAAAFAAIDRVVQTGQDPRRFIEDLLERLRDLIVVAATGDGASAVLRGIPVDELGRMSRQAGVFGADRLSRTADIVVAALDEMTGATSPRLQLELMVARVLAHTAEAPAVAPAPPAASSTPRADGPAAPAAPAATSSVAAPSPPVAAPSPAAPAAAPPAAAPPVEVPAGPVTLQRLRDSWTEVMARLEQLSRTSWLIAVNARATALEGDVLTLAFPTAADVAAFKRRAAGQGPSEDLRQAIQSVLGIRVKYIARHDADDAPGGGGSAVPPSSGPAPSAPAAPVAPPSGSGAPAAPAAPRPSAPAPSAPVASAPVTEWAVAAIPTTSSDEPGPAAALAQLAVDDEPEEAASATARVATLSPPREGEVLPPAEVVPASDDDDESEQLDVVDPPQAPPVVPQPVRSAPGAPQRYGEAVVRQMLGARFVREEPYEPKATFH